MSVVGRHLWLSPRLKLLIKDSIFKESKLLAKSYSSNWKPVAFTPEIFVPNFSKKVNESRKVLNKHAEKVAHLICGEPNGTLSSSTNLRYGTKGSLSISLKEDKSGIWFNFETSEGGDMFDLIQKEKNLSHQETQQFVDDLISQNLSKLKTFPEDMKSTVQESGKRQANKTQVFAQRLIFESLPLENTVAETYLKTHRKIEFIDSPNLRYHPSVFIGGHTRLCPPALLAIASTPSSSVQNVQVIYLDSETCYKNTEVLVSKQTFGSFHDTEGFHMCVLNDSDSSEDITFVAEGVETGLSVVQAFPENHHIATLGKFNFNNLDVKRLHKNVVLIWDNDGVTVQEDPVFKKCASRLLRCGKTVSVVQPPLLKGKKKVDMNDVLKASGISGVHRIVKQYSQNVIL